MIDLVILIVLLIALAVALLWPGKLPEWQDLHGQEYLNWREKNKR